MSGTNATPIYAAMCFESSVDKGSDPEQPLLLNEESTEKEELSCDVESLNSRFRMHGLILGFLVQVINVAGTTYMYLRWGEGAITTRQEGWLLHAVIWILTQADLYLYVLMWVALTSVLTKRGMDYVRCQYFSQESVPSKRSIFVMGVNFYVGVVVGVFLAWTGIDIVLGLPVPVLPMIFVLLFGLFISYTMVWCYDLEEEEVEDEN